MKEDYFKHRFYLFFLIFSLITIFLFLLPAIPAYDNVLCTLSNKNILNVQTLYSIGSNNLIEKVNENQTKISISSLEEKKRQEILDKINTKPNITLGSLSSTNIPPKIANYTIITKEEIVNKLNKDLNFKKVYNYSKSLGYDEIGNSIKVFYSDGRKATFTEVYNKSSKKIPDKLPTFLISITDDKSFDKSFLMELINRDNSSILKMYDDVGGVEINLSDLSIVSSWGHHSCAYWDCVVYGIDWIFSYQNPGQYCIEWCIGVEIVPVNPISVAVCYGCLIGLGATSLELCGLNSCTFYPCQDDCNDYDWYGSFVNYCKNEDVYKHRIFYNSYCPTNQPREGTCSINSGYTDDTFVESCSYGCSDGACLDSVECYSDIECGSDRWTGSRFCSGGDVWQNRLEYDCSNPGTPSASCSSATNPELKEDCSASGCVAGNCVDPISACSPFNETYCNGQCWDFCSPGSKICCPSSGNPTQCYDEANSVCKTDGSICSPVPEMCNNLDDNCDDVIDSINENCGLGICSNGTRTCTSGSWGSCSTSGLSTSETCNNLDDDCDGSTDESLTQECGTDEGICVKGTQTCSIGEWGTCGGAYVGPENETCNGLDDNCNGIIDEDNVCGNYPNGTLISPNNNYISYTGNITFSCSAKDETNLKNITLYHNLNGNMTANETKIITGKSNSTNWTINNIQDGDYIWNCLIYDNDSHFSWASNTTYNLNVSIIFPSIDLIYPSNYTKFPNHIKNVTFNISVVSNTTLLNCTIYTNISGSWQPNSTKSISGTSNLTSFNIDNIDNGTFIWNTLCYDIENKFAWARNNWTFTINFTGESGCQELNTPNSIYTLKNNVSASGTCFNVTANNITIDGQGYTISYALSSSGYGAFISGVNFTNINNLKFKLDDSSRTKSPSIFTQKNNNINITNVTINIKCDTTTSNVNCHGISILNVDNSFISGANINVTGHTSDDISITTSGTDTSITHKIINSNLSSYGPQSSGITIFSANGGIDGITITDSKISSENYYGIRIDGGPDILGKGNANITRVFSNSKLTNRHALYLTDSELSFIIDSNFSTISDSDIKIDSGQHEFINTSYVDETVSAGKLIRKWYLDTKVNDPSGIPTSQANVSIWNITGGLQFSGLTNSSGFISRQSLIEYTNDAGTKTYSTPHTINSSKQGYGSSTAQVNLTITQNKFLEINLVNTIPVINSLVLNSSFGKNMTTENLTVYVTTNDSDGDNVKKIYNWYKNNKSLSSLYLPFEGQSNSTYTKDYSNGGNNAEVVGAEWNRSGGYDGFGSYTFNDNNERIIIQDSPNIEMNNNFTILTWVYPETDLYAIAIKDTLDSNYDYRFYSYSGYLRFRWGNGSSVGSASCDGCTEETNKWLHLGVVYKCNNTGSSVDFYINGRYNQTSTSSVNCIKSGSSDLWIGSRENLAYTLNGKIDEFKIYNYSVSTNQIKAIFENKTNMLLSDELSSEEDNSYKCEVTPYDTKQDGASINSSELLLIGFPGDTDRFYIRNSLGENVSWFGDKGNLVLKGTCISGGTCTASDGNSFIIKDSSGNEVAHIDNNGNLCIESGDCSDQSATCNPATSAFIIRNSTNSNVGYIDYTGDLCLTGRLYENSEP
ncbi:LamG domain-containing protein [Candidatus Pacearchaeota archaeon]|nr:LamG domain-containing protein [Candidatus Pacearchaeota archaeon]